MDVQHGYRDFRCSGGELHRRGQKSGIVCQMVIDKNGADGPVTMGFLDLFDLDCPCCIFTVEDKRTTGQNSHVVNCGVVVVVSLGEWRLIQNHWSGSQGYCRSERCVRPSLHLYHAFGTGRGSSDARNDRSGSAMIGDHLLASPSPAYSDRRRADEFCHQLDRNALVHE